MVESFEYATVCSGIGAPEVAWKELWGPPVFTSEIAAFPSAVLKHHMPDVPNYGDMTKYKEWPEHGQLRLICGGTPCQSFSVAGLRKGMDDPRGNLTLTFLGLLARYNPRWFVWENVPGVFSSGDGRDLAGFIRGLQELGYGCAWRVLDAQYFGVPQRRRRVFVVGHIGNDWRPPFAVLFEPESLRGFVTPIPKAGKRDAWFASSNVGGYSCASEKIAKPLLSHGGPNGRQNPTDENYIIMTAHGRSEYKDTEEKASPLRANMAKQSDSDLILHAIHPHAIGRKDEAGPQVKPYRTDGKAYTHDSRGVAQAVAIRTAQTNANGHGISEGVSHTLDGAQGQAVAFKVRCGCEGGGKGYLGSEDKTFTVSTSHDQNIFYDSIVRRLTPLECERLQGFPDGYTLIPGKYKFKAERHEAILQFIMRHFNLDRLTAISLAGNPDGPRYKALGNSMAVPVLNWIGRRIKLFESLRNSGDIRS